MLGLSSSVNWNDSNLKPLSRINWIASMVPSATVIPSPIAYIKVVAVKKLLVGLLVGAIGPTLCVGAHFVSRRSCVEPAYN